MKASSSSSARVAVALVLSGCVVAFAAQVRAQVKGTRTVISSPYSRQMAPTAAEVTAMKTRAAKERIATISNSKIGRKFVAFSTCSGTKVIGKPGHGLRGTDTADKPVVYDLAELDEVRADIVQQDRTLFEVKRFPVITVAKLIADQPSYTELRAVATATTSAWVRTANEDGTACLVEQGADDGKWNVFAHLGKLEKDTVLTFDYAWKTSSNAAVWWAIPSVVLDAAYPYKREVALKR